MTTNRMGGKMIRQPVYDTNQRPFMIIWETTQACDLACRHCRAQAQPLHDPLALNTAEAKRLMDQAETFGRPYPIFIFTGGDPFKREDLFELVRYAAQLGLPVGVSPSGTPLLTEENLQHLKDAGAKAISLSIDGCTAEKHDDFRRVPGSFELTTNGWRAARKLNLKVQINTTVTRYNLLDLPQIFRLVQEMGAMTWSLFFLVPTGRGKQEDEITPAEYEAVMHFLYDVSKYISAKPTEGHHYKRIVLQRAILEEKGIPPENLLSLPPTYYVLKQGLDQVVQQAGLTPREKGIHRTPMHINAANGFVFISCRGEVFPSGFLPLNCGNVRTRSLVEIYRNSPLFIDLRNTDKYEGRCGVCEFAPVCGGSRSRAYAMTGDPLAEEPFCSYEPHSFPYQEELNKFLNQASHPALA
ncbi:MAG TPA: TIGR04053 family radical SAM/SPASM domain-containing protein [Acidobacteriota bacterium]|nr:TIGR04053 family radical SAM/SPASM domain-containing protein [Acidobacteriota bacterium]